MEQLEFACSPRPPLLDATSRCAEAERLQEEGTLENLGPRRLGSCVQFASQPASQLLQLRRHQSARLQVQRGQLWLTQDGRLEDRHLQGGENTLL
ncbi:DUF2917 domain-containing protein [Roseateles sp.]|uniref:DUF2917 domain-containing protein n=1 Tax=Roseateles sp. TaxID=1971397 RepID=UPI003D120A24